MSTYRFQFDLPLTGAVLRPIGPDAPSARPESAAADPAVDDLVPAATSGAAHPQTAGERQPAGGRQTGHTQPAAKSESGPSSEAVAQLAEATARLHQSLDQLQRQLRDGVQQQQSEQSQLQAAAVELATVVAAQLVRRTFASDQRDVIEAVAETLDKASASHLSAGPAVAHLHPRDLALLMQQLQQREAPWDAALQFAADPQLPPGACRVEGPRQGWLDHWLHTLAEIRQEMLDQIDVR